MGVPGLWEVLRAAGVSRSLTSLALDGFCDDGAGREGTRGCRIGVDASIWFVHATYGKEGENPELRTIFFRLTRLLKLPFLPLFVFDGPMRPDIKRGKTIDKKPHWMIQGMQRMLDAFGFEWRTAPGEAEAELAYLNRIGVIDAVLSDDVDTLVFGAHSIIRNPSENLSGNRAQAQATKNHTMTFSASDIRTHAQVGLTVPGLILVALLSGGDYHKGVEGCGIAASAALARCGFGEPLVAKVRSLALRVQHAENKRTRVKLSRADQEELEEFLKGWREEVAEELRTNSRKLLVKKSPKAAANLLAMGEDFPDVDVLMAYINPVTSEERAVAKAVKQQPGLSDTSNVVLRAREKIAQELRASIVWPNDPSVGEIAKVCEDYFEWGYREMILKRFANWLWEGIVCRELRRKAINSRVPRSTNPPALARITKIHSTRTHATTDNALEYRLEVDPAALASAAASALTGRRQAVSTGWSDNDSDQDDDDDEGKSGKGKKEFDENASVRMWIPACLVEEAEPEIVKAFEEKKKAKAAKGKKATKTTEKKAARGKKVPTDSGSDDDLPVSSLAPVAPPQPIRAKSSGGGVDTFFKARKTTAQPFPLASTSKSHSMPTPFPAPAPSTSSSASRDKSRAKEKDKAKLPEKAPTKSTIARVASLFDDVDIPIKDLTVPKASGSRPRPADTAVRPPKLNKARTDPGPASSSGPLWLRDNDAEEVVFKDLTVPATKPKARPVRKERTWIDPSASPEPLPPTPSSSHPTSALASTSHAPSTTSLPNPPRTVRAAPSTRLKAAGAPTRRVQRTHEPVVVASSSSEHSSSENEDDDDAEEPPLSQPISRLTSSHSTFHTLPSSQPLPSSSKSLPSSQPLSRITSKGAKPAAIARAQSQPAPQPPREDSVIEITSDEDEDRSMVPLPAKDVRMPVVTTKRRTSPVEARRERAETDVIDLCSDSD